MQTKEYSMEIGGEKLSAQFTDLADQTNGSVLMSFKGTTVLATAVLANGEKEGMDYMPLTVDYEEKFYAAGLILGSKFMRREGRPSDEAILTGRMTDRTIRPLFDQRIRNEIQVVITVLSIDKVDPDILAINAASLALATSDIPWDGPVSAVRVSKFIGGDSEYEVMPSMRVEENGNTEIELIVCGKDGNINMIEMSGLEIEESVVTAGFDIASKEIEKIQKFQKNIIAEIGKKKVALKLQDTGEDIKNLFESEIAKKLPSIVMGKPGAGHIYEFREEWVTLCKEKLGASVSSSVARSYFEEMVDKLIHDEAIKNNRRADGRKLDEVRSLYAKAGGVSPVLHGSGIFYRGGTHVLSVLTLAGPGEAQILDGMEINEKKSFMHHYNFPPFSSGETGRMGGTNRRMIGHGALAEKALKQVLPSKTEFPYTIRIVSESMASNGSTSMASVCGSTIALLDAGVPIKEPVAGIAIGLMMKDEDNYKILTDIQGPEDHYGDMDFKVAGTKNGVTAIQMDVKVGGIPSKILSQALVEAKRARLHILDVIHKEISTHRKDISPRAPKILSLKINPDQIGHVIGPGGKMINKIRDDSGVDGIDIEDDGTVFITGKNGTAEKAYDIIEKLTHEYKAGERFEGRVVKIMDFGAFVEIAPGKDGLVHVSEIASFRVTNVSEVLKEGDVVPVVVKEVDKEKGRIALSIKLADPNFIKAPKK